ncbi:MAG TPA: hypothetical protein VF998_05225 [Candidatus Limnocylindria bacterium]
MVSPERYGDRLDAARYRDDEPVGAGLLAAKPGYEGWIWIPERLFTRMQLLAAAYELHVLPRLDPLGDNVLDRERAGTLVDELEFLARVVEDPLLLEHLEALRDAALACTRSPFPDVPLAIEGP